MNKTVLTIEHTLPCGHTLACRNVFEHTDGDVPAPNWVTKHGAPVLEYYLADRTARHRCELVTGQNPEGTTPLDRKAPHAN